MDRLFRLGIGHRGTGHLDAVKALAVGVHGLQTQDLVRHVHIHDAVVMQSCPKLANGRHRIVDESV